MYMLMQVIVLLGCVKKNVTGVSVCRIFSLYAILVPFQQCDGDES
jgi:hypothetical protein